jgi:hypothetical protein
MVDRIRRFMLFEAAAFIAASIVHSGALAERYAHREARIAETVIALVLLAGLTWSRLRPEKTRLAGLLAQGFALFATLVGIFTIVIGVGPRSGPDAVYHLGIVGILAWGLTVAARAGRRAPGQHAGEARPYGDAPVRGR